MPNPIKVQASVHSVVPHGAGVYEVAFKPEGNPPRFKAGQFLHLTVDDFDPSGGFWPESRVFSIASEPGSELIQIVYSVKGLYTKKMEAELKPGRQVWLKLPYGDFIIDKSIEADQDVVLVAGGTGVSPFIPYLAGISEKGLDKKQVRLYYGTRLKSFVLFPDVISGCARNQRGFKAVISIESESSKGLDVPGATVRDGRLSIETILAECGDLKNTVYFLSGPPIMIKLFRTQLAEKGVSQNCIKIDDWE